MTDIRKRPATYSLDIGSAADKISNICLFETRFQEPPTGTFEMGFTPSPHLPPPPAARLPDLSP